MPRKPLVRTSLLNANPIFTLVTWRCFVPPLHPRPVRDQAVFWRFPTYPRRGNDSRLTTDSVASSSLCGSLAGLHSAGAATNIGDRVLWEQLTTAHVLDALHLFLEMCCSEPTGVPNTVMPSGCQASSPTSPMLSGTTPARFQVPDGTQHLRTSTRIFRAA